MLEIIVNVIWLVEDEVPFHHSLTTTATYLLRICRSFLTTSSMDALPIWKHGFGLENWRVLSSKSPPLSWIWLPHQKTDISISNLMIHLDEQTPENYCYYRIQLPYVPKGLQDALDPQNPRWKMKICLKLSMKC
ncbi:hypothetical protein B9Z55_027955 [Caenorhabditis nigoni]|uniref:Uncharacterized protein n=1 Tax=Caenorhabditis nigoni TaxID=1611254 RepID=A0A2G5SDE8_9PELO|nr:hypothetical protein B9Z55_027955 [Caenorhabditis nigoni]